MYVLTRNNRDDNLSLLLSKSEQNSTQIGAQDIRKLICFKSTLTNKHKNAFSFSSTFLGTMLELSTNTFTLLKNPYHKNSTIILCSVLCNMGQTLELAGAIQEVQWFKMMV